MYNIYIYIYIHTHTHTHTVYNRIKHMPAEYCEPTELAAVPPFGMVQNTYWTRTVQYQRIYTCILFWKVMLNRSFIVILCPIYGLLKEIINHNRSKFVLSKLVLTGVCCKHFMYAIHVYTVRVHFLVCMWSVCLPTLWSDFYLTSKIPTIFF